MQLSDTFSWAKLSSGEWGVRVDCQFASQNGSHEGLEVTIKNRYGNCKTVKLGKPVERKTDWVSIYSVQ